MPALFLTSLQDKMSEIEGGGSERGPCVHLDDVIVERSDHQTRSGSLADPRRACDEHCPLIHLGIFFLGSPLP